MIFHTLSELMGRMDSRDKAKWKYHKQDVQFKA